MGGFSLGKGIINRLFKFYKNLNNLKKEELWNSLVSNILKMWDVLTRGYVSFHSWGKESFHVRVIKILQKIKQFKK